MSPAADPASRPLTTRGGFVCPECRLVLPAIHDAFVTFFRGVALSCPECRKTLPSLWDLAIQTVEEDWTFMSVFQLAGARQTYGRARLKPDRTITINFGRWRIPKTAEILHVKYSGLGPAEGPMMLPLRFEPNASRPEPHRLLVYGATYGRRPGGPAQVMVSVSWVRPGPDEVSVHHLAAAVKQYADGRYDGVIIPANIAVEAVLGRALEDWVTAFCSKDDLGDFLTRGATYAHQLKVLSSIAADTLRVPRLDTAIRRRLDKLRSYRNDMGHRGKTGVHPKRLSLSKAAAGEFVTAAIFGYHYARYLHVAVRRLRRRRRNR